MNRQLNLPLRLRDTASLDNFFQNGNEEAFSALKRWLNEREKKPVLYLYGSVGSGRSHLLQAACRFLFEQHSPTLYVPAGGPDIDDGLISQLDPRSTVVIDDLDKIVGDLQWEEAILEVYERLSSSSGGLLLSALKPPLMLGCKLPDLATRFVTGGVYHIRSLTHRELPKALQLRARSRGLDLSEEVVKYLLHRMPRSSQAMFNLLDQIDEAAFSEKRRLTIPFIKEMENRLGLLSSHE